MKKIYKYLLVLILCSLLSFPVYAKDITGCSILGENVKIDEKIANTVHVVILIIQIAGPVLLVIFGMMDLLKAIIAGKEDEIKKGQMTFIKRLLAGVIMFLVFLIVKILVNFVADDSEGILNCANCFVNGPNSSSCSTK